MLVQGFNLHFPSLKIIGEETEEFGGKIHYNYSQLQLDILPPDSNINQHLDINKACLWIDPIDCTLGFIRGKVEDVTVLIGLAYNQ